jgi:hypothetical protein
MMPQLRKVRTKDGVFQVQTERSLPLPCGESFDEWVEDMKLSMGELEDTSVEYENANEEYSTELNVKGWMDATPEQVAILREHDFS